MQGPGATYCARRGIWLPIHVSTIHHGTLQVMVWTQGPPNLIPHRGPSFWLVAQSPRPSSLGTFARSCIA